MKLRTAVLTAAFGLSTMVGGFAIGANAAQTPTPAHTPTLPSCTHEDSSDIIPCIWDGQYRGNGKGSSFIMINNDGDASSFIPIP